MNGSEPSFRPCLRDSSGDKGQFRFISQKNAIGISPPYRFCMSTSAILLLQNFSPTATTDLYYQALTVYSKPSKFTT